MNNVFLIGTLGRDPEVRYTQDNRPIANISLATTKRWKDKNTGEKQEHTEWHRVVFFGSVAGIVEKYVKKGSKIAIRGYLKTRKWTGQDGKDNYTTEVVVDNSGILDLISSKNGTSDNSGQEKEPQQTAKVAETSTEPAFDDEIPF